MPERPTPARPTPAAAPPESTSTDAPRSTLLCMLLDRSGSMQAIKSDVDGGFDAFIAAQRAVAGECRVTLNQFDHEYERVHTLVDVGAVPPLDLEPRGTTALLDSIGRTVTDLQHDLDAMSDADRPDAVIVVILTDGFENASVEWTHAAVKQLVESKQPAWEFVFIGADQDAIAEGAKVGVAADASLRQRATRASTQGVFNLLSDKVMQRRVVGQRVAFADDDRAAALGDQHDPDHPDDPT